jgi:hypothetical protein
MRAKGGSVSDCPLVRLAQHRKILKTLEQPGMVAIPMNQWLRFFEALEFISRRNRFQGQVENTRKSAIFYKSGFRRSIMRSHFSATQNHSLSSHKRNNLHFSRLVAMIESAKMVKAASDVIPLSKRPQDIVILVFFWINLIFITYMVDVEQLISCWFSTPHSASSGLSSSDR